MRCSQVSGMRLLLGIVASLLASAGKADNSGTASFYGGNLSGGTCMFSSYALPSGVFGTALGGASWANSAMCGACLRVTGPKGKVKVMVSAAQPYLTLAGDSARRRGRS